MLAEIEDDSFTLEGGQWAGDVHSHIVNLVRDRVPDLSKALMAIEMASQGEQAILMQLLGSSIHWPVSGEKLRRVTDVIEGR